MPRGLREVICKSSASHRRDAFDRRPAASRPAFVGRGRSVFGESANHNAKTLEPNGFRAHEKEASI